MASIMTAWTVIVLTLEGRLISFPQPCGIAAKVLTRIPVAEPRLILDLRAVPSVDASGVGLIAALCGAARDRGGDLRLLGLRERPRRLLEICGLLPLLQSFDREEDALESFVGRDAPELYLERAPMRLREPRWSSARMERTGRGGDLASQRSGRMTA